MLRRLRYAAVKHAAGALDAGSASPAPSTWSALLALVTPVATVARLWVVASGAERLR